MKLKEIKKLTKKQLIKELKLVDKKYASWDLRSKQRFFLNTELKKRK
tara:strand:- start:39 stop:179 length:141 start_codon:yes stop_codon:yes gene_type:complete